MRREVRGHPLAGFSSHISLLRPHELNTWNRLSSVSILCNIERNQACSHKTPDPFFFEYALILQNCGDGFNIVRGKQKCAWADFNPFLNSLKGNTKDSECALQAKATDSIVKRLVQVRRKHPAKAEEFQAVLVSLSRAFCVRECHLSLGKRYSSM